MGNTTSNQDTHYSTDMYIADLESDIKSFRSKSVIASKRIYKETNPMRQITLYNEFHDELMIYIQEFNELDDKHNMSISQEDSIKSKLNKILVDFENGVYCSPKKKRRRD
jgi:hypothetical protein